MSDRVDKDGIVSYLLSDEPCFKFTNAEIDYIIVALEEYKD